MVFLIFFITQQHFASIVKYTKNKNFHSVVKIYQKTKLFFKVLSRKKSKCNENIKHLFVSSNNNTLYELVQQTFHNEIENKKVLNIHGD